MSKKQNGKPVEQKLESEKLTQQAQQAIELPTAVVIGRRVEGEWQFARIDKGVFQGTVQEQDLLDAVTESLDSIFTDEYKDGDRIQIKIDIVREEDDAPATH